MKRIFAVIVAALLGVIGLSPASPASAVAKYTETTRNVTAAEGSMVGKQVPGTNFVVVDDYWKVASCSLNNGEIVVAQTRFQKNNQGRWHVVQTVLDGHRTRSNHAKVLIEFRNPPYEDIKVWEPRPATATTHFAGDFHSTIGWTVRGFHVVQWYWSNGQGQCPSGVNSH